VLPARSRMRRSEEFRLVSRRGRRASRPRLVAHLLLPAAGEGDVPARVGFVVSKAVGGSVVRHRVARRLRHLVRERLGSLPPGSLLVVRATPQAAGAGSGALGDDLDRALTRLLPSPGFGR
jgi:ribonuclease P protein component